MDCIIPGVSIRPFCAAISSLSRMGKELYVDFDPLDGLSLRALSDSKSVFGSYHFEPAFFTSCASAMESPAKRKKSSKGKKRKHHTPDDDDDDDSVQRDDDDEDDANNVNERWTVKIAFKALAPIVRSRKDVLHLKLLTDGDHLDFEFHLQKFDGSNVRIVHKVGYAAANGVAAVASTDGASELVMQPHVLATMLEPLKRSIEIALLVNETHRLVSSVTFSHDDLPKDSTSALSTHQHQASLKTEVSVGYDDLAEVHYVGLAGHDDNDDKEDEEDSDQPKPLQPPDDIKEQVVLVFTLKEFKAFLQFCAQAVMDQELQLSIQFHWGGRPMVIKTMGESFHGELVMATLDHTLLGKMRTSNTSNAATGDNGANIGT